MCSAILFIGAFAWLKPYLEYGMNDLNQRVNRVVVMFTLLYMSCLIFMLNLRPDHGRAFLGFLDSSLNRPITKEMLAYDDSCEFEWKNIWDNLDHYYVAHLFSWFLSCFVARDPYVLLFMQLLDEVLELSVQHIYFHFRECWWDHLLLDIALSNIPGICLGMTFIRWVGIRE